MKQQACALSLPKHWIPIILSLSKGGFNRTGQLAGASRQPARSAEAWPQRPTQCAHQRPVAAVLCMERRRGPSS